MKRLARASVHLRRRLVAACLVGAVAAAVALTAQGATIIWGGGTGTFGTAANWVGGSAPGSSDTASFDGWIPLPTAGWTATASNTNGADPLTNAFDGKRSTRWSTGTNQVSGIWFKMDLAASMTFSRVDMDSNSAATDYPRNFTLAVSTDDSSYTTVATTTGSNPMTTVTFSAQTARYIKITLTSSQANWWGINEFTVYGSSAWVPLSTSGWTVTASRSDSSETVSKSIDGDRSTRWSTGAGVLTTDWYKVDMGSNKTFSRVEWDGNPTTWSSDYPPTWTLAVSTDNSTYTTVTTGSASSNDTNVIFSAQTARYIKISANSTACGGGCWWGIAEFRAFTPTQTTQLSRNGWTVTASNTDGASPVGNAIDNDLTTRWASGVAQSNGLWFKVDMTQSLTINAITMDSYTSTTDYPNAWKLETSTDNSTYTTVTATQVPAAPYIAYQFAPRTARYVRVTQTGSTSSWWSIHEFNVYGTPVNASISSSATVSAVNIAESVTLTQASGNTLTTSGDFTQSAGTFTGGNSLISIGGDFNLSGGTFTSTSGVLEVSGAYNATGGTFTHNSGRVLLDSTSNQTFATNGNTFYDLTINDGLLAYWKMDNSASPSTDSSGWARDATWAGSTTTSTTVLPTVNFTDSRSLSLASTTNDRATLTSPTTTDVTITAWVYSSARNNAFPRIVEMPAYQLSFTDNNQTSPQVNNCVSWSAITSGAQFGYRSPASSITDNTWYHVGVTMTSAGVGQIYINGVLQTTTQPTAGSGTVISNSGTAYIGNRAALDRGWTGKIDEVRVYGRILSAAEINSLYIGNQPGTSQATQTMTGAPTVANDLTLASGTLSAGANTLTVTGSWNNYGGLFSSTGNIILNGTGSEVIRSAGQPFKNLTLNGSGGTYTLEDWLKATSAITLTAGTLSPGSYAIHAMSLRKTSGLFTAGTGTVVLDTTADDTQDTGFSFNNLRIEAPDETGLVGYWKLDEGQGTTAGDALGNGNSGTLYSNAKWTTSLPSTAFDNHSAVSLNGTSDYVSLGNPAAMNFSGQITLAAWANMTSSSGTQNIVAHGYDASTEVFLRISGGVYQAGSWVNPTSYQATYSVPGGDVGAWVHLASVYDGTAWRLYRNGTEVANTTTATGAQTVAANWAIGARGDGTSRWFGGKVDDVRIYNVALTAAQVKNLAQGRYSGKGSNTTVTLGANSSASGALSIDSGTLYSSSYTMNASSASNVVSVGSGATYHVGSAMQTMQGGLTVYDSGTLTLDTASGSVALGNGSLLTMNGTLNASSTTAAIQAVSGAGNKYTFSIGTTPTSTPTLNITGLQVKNTGSNGMFINTDTSSVTTFTRFDNIAFSVGASTAANNYNLHIYANSLYLVSNGCTFDNGVSATVANNVYLAGNGTADGETRVVFGNATCASDKASCEAYDLDDDSTADGIGDTPASNGAVIQWISGAEADVTGSIEGFPTAAFDWSSYTWYSSYVAYHDVSGTTDRVYARKTNGDAYYYWDAPSGTDLIGTPRWDTVSGTHYVYVATTSGKVYRLIDNTTAHTLTADTASPWDGANNPFDCSCTINTPLAQDTSNLYFGGNVSSTYKLWTVSKTSTTRQPTGSPLLTGATTNNAAPAVWVSGHTYVFEGQAGRVTKLDVTPNMSLVGDNTNPGSSNAVTGRITVISNTLYAGDDNGYMWSLDPGSNFVGTTKNWGYHDATNHAACGGVCQVKNHYVDAQYTHTIYGDQDGHLYVLDSTGVGYKPTSTTLYPWRPGTSADAFATAPLYRGGVIVIGSTNGFLYVVDQNKDNTVPALIQTYKFGGSSTAVSGIAFDSSTNTYMVSTANATNKDGKLYYIAASSDPTGGFL